MKILFAGDILIKEQKPFLSQELKKIFNSCDICICNFEAPVRLNSEDPIIKAGPAIYQSDSSIEVIKEMGFNMASLANNHIMDYGEKALESTINLLKSNNIISIGASITFKDAYTPYIIKTGEKKIAFIALSQAEFGVLKSENDSMGYAWINHPDVNHIISETKKEVDFLYIIAHAGLENIVYPLPEWRRRYKEMIDAGADYIIGAHPHIIQGYEIYKEKYIFYSLGNFYFNLNNNKLPEGNQSIIVICDTDNPTLRPEIINCIVDNNIIKINDTKKGYEIVNERSELLKNESLYIHEIDKIAEKLWYEYYGSYYLWPFEKEYNTLTRRIKNILKIILNRKIENKAVINETMLLHNIQIETHRWIVERYLYNINKKKNNF